ncbi:glycine-rich domain-containing protein-like [Larkinella bovis]|uniref:Glycine-rich domain-containing protein-like n=1 Tax=Larkinella bovis TaxID=683041 RepID=A0ABW0IBF5_9BACT
MNTSVEATRQIQLSINFQERPIKRLLFWQDDKLRRVVALNRYKKFLFLIKKYPNQKFIPTVDIDYYWHQHLESPVSYYNDCINIFGNILSHNGGFGRNRNERQQWKELFQKTSYLWQLEYNEPYKTNVFCKAKYCTSEVRN